MSNGLLAFEDRLSLLEKCIDAFGLIFRREYRRVAQSPASKVRRSETYAFYPIAGIAFNHGQVWARTFGADYFPVRLVEADGALHLDGLTYRISVPGAAKDEFAEAVDIYRRPGTQAVVRQYDCESKELELHVFSKQRGVDESIFFRPAGG